ncbi:hypothetical protein M0R45_010463 [Rubus argutus]|uniref:TIR domain-containing protein n=1 Tax=Rubus argutus TaxID=59490 RepID=A0AAW1YAG6_RUBAR
MDLQVVNMASSSSAADVCPQQPYDVFLSFRGEDTRHKFTSHLYAALDRNKIYTYIDDRLERGDEIGPALFTAIEQSKLSVIIFSKDYASSSWCLDEVVHILKCKQEYGQLVIPVFYDIDPSYVRRQQGTYADAFAVLEERFKDNMEKVRKWRDALTIAANLSGVHSQNIRPESELVGTIVKDILTKLNRNSSYVVKGLVGMESHIREIELLLCIHAQDVCSCTIGICGMGGVGKTTLADAVFHRNSSKFDACLFLANVRERSEKHELYDLRNELLSTLLKEVNLSIGSPSIGSSYIIDRLSRTKVLVVLDDVSDLSQLETLLADQVKFGRGSRIIITTRNRLLLKEIRVHEDHIYKMTELSVVEALQLFQSKAFRDDSCITDYSNLSRKVVDYAGCNPLALKVLASSFLHCNNREDWEEELNKLKKFPNTKIQNVLRISYNGLEENEKGIFLDIACFLKGENMCNAKKLLEMHGFSASTGIQALIDMSLISIKYDRLEMHDLLQEMGRAIDRGIEVPGKRKRLWNAEDAYQVLHNNTGTSTVESIFLDVSKIPEIQLSTATFKNMLNLKLLKFYVPQEVHEERKRQRTWSVEEQQLSSFPWLPGLKAVQSFLTKSRIWRDVYRKVCNYDDKVFNEYCKVYLPGGLESLPEKLRYLYWDGYPLKSLPSQYYPENLVELHFPHSQVKQLWNNVQNLGSLKHLNLSDSPYLIEVPDLSGSPNIERINLSGCTILAEVPSYFQNLENLTYLNLCGCKNLKKLSELPCNLEELHLNGSGIEEISPSIWSHEKLHTLNLKGCRFLKNLPSSSSSSNSGGTGKLKYFRLMGCLVLESVPDNIYNSNRLETLHLSWCVKLKRLPPLSVGRLCCLRDLELAGCIVLESIPDGLLSVSTLEYIVLSETMIESIPSSIINASGLRKLFLTNCKKLKVIPELPSQLVTLEASGCTSLKSVASSRSALMQQPCSNEFTFTDCLELDESARSYIMGDAQLRIMRMASSSSNQSNGGLTTICPGNEIPRWFSYHYHWEGCESNNIQFPKTKTTTKGPMKEICLNFVVSAVVVANAQDVSLFEWVCDCNFKTNDGKGYTRVIYGPSHWRFAIFKKDHVVTFFQRAASFRCEENSITQASFHLYPKSIVHEDENRMSMKALKVKKCGVRILYCKINDESSFLCSE